MAGITELYTAKAMLDSQMIYGGKQGENLFIVLWNRETRMLQLAN